MASPPVIARAGRSDWTLMTVIHDALRRDLNQLLRTGARWGVFRDQLRFHLAAQDAVMWWPACARLAGDPHGQALLDAMEDEHQLIGPLLAVTDDAFTMDAGPARLRQLLARLRTQLTSHLAHEETDALPPISQIMTPRELGRIATAIRGGTGAWRPGATSRGPSPAPLPTSVSRYAASCPHPPGSSARPSGCRVTRAVPRHREHRPGRPLPLPRPWSPIPRSDQLA
jgi:hypothetical protein